MYVAKNTVLHLSQALTGPALPDEIDLRDADAPMLLARLDMLWDGMSRSRREAALNDMRLTLPVPEIHGTGIVVLPGGAVAVRCGAEGVMVCDPLEAVALSAAPAAKLRKTVAAQPGLITLAHEDAGLVLHSGLPASLPLQACSIVADASCLARLVPAARNWLGRALVQWRQGGAVIWPLVAAPDTLALAASVAGLAVAPGAAPLSPVLWGADGRAAQTDAIGPGLFERTSDLLMDEVSDDLRLALAERAVTGEASLAMRLVEALRVLPAPFSADPRRDAGRALLRAWGFAEAALAESETDLVMIGIEAGADGMAGLDALREILQGEGLFFTESRSAKKLAASISPAAQAMARRLGAGERFGLLIAPPASPAELFASAETLARHIGGRVVVAAPCWGFYQRCDARDGSEAGNAGWFGMGAGLDELDWI